MLIFCMVWMLLSPCFSQITTKDIDVRKIWDSAPHNAFTDLVKYRGRYYCTFREGTGHIPAKDGSGDGGIRLLESKDGIKWESVALLTKKGYDLRDPKLAVTPGKRLMIQMGGSIYKNGEFTGRLPFVSFMEKDGTLSGVIPVAIDEAIKTNVDWLWRVTWYKGIGYGTVYQVSDRQEWKLYLVKTSDGVNYQYVSQLVVDGKPNESTIGFLKSDEMQVVVRREAGTKTGYIGRSKFPYAEWKWDDLGIRLGGPNMITLPNGKTIIGTRSYHGNIYRTALFEFVPPNGVKELLELPSLGDTGYPGLITVRRELWVSYNSAHEGKVAIYLARIRNFRKL